MRYILLVNDRVEPATLQAFLDRVVGPETKDTIMTAGERLIQKGIEQGVRQGVEQGERGLLLRMLRKRFGSAMSAEVEQQVMAAGPAQIALWAERVLTAQTLSELLAD